MEFAFDFIQVFGLHLLAAWPLMLMLSAIVLLLGLAVGRLENWPWFDAIYWGFITATTVGYGDIRPLRRPSRLLAILIAFTGVTFTGIFVALAINAATLAFHGKEPQLRPRSLMFEPAPIGGHFTGEAAVSQKVYSSPTLANETVVS